MTFVLFNSKVNIKKNNQTTGWNQKLAKTFSFSLVQIIWNKLAKDQSVGSISKCWMISIQNL